MADSKSVGQGANTSDVYLDPSEVCHSGGGFRRHASCQPPCRFIMPQCQIPTTTITATYTISLEVYAPPSRTSTMTVTTAVTVTTNSVSFEPVYVGGGRASGDYFDPVTVIPMPSIVIPVTRPGGGVTTRVVSLPNWPTMGLWPVTGGSGSTDPWEPPRNTAAAQPFVGDEPSYTPPPMPPKLPSPVLTWEPPEPTPWTNTTTPSLSSSTTTTTTTAVPVPIVVWPSRSIQFTGDDDDDHGDELPCNLWFFSVRLDVGKKRKSKKEKKYDSVAKCRKVPQCAATC